jgi:hypothetical protein
MTRKDRKIPRIPSVRLAMESLLVMGKTGSDIAPVFGASIKPMAAPHCGQKIVSISFSKLH